MDTPLIWPKAISDLSRTVFISVEECGLFIDLYKGYLAASPYGTVGKDSLVEVKCPYVCRDNSIEDLERQDHSFCLEFDFVEDKLRLKMNHSYLYYY